MRTLGYRLLASTVMAGVFAAGAVQAQDVGVPAAGAAAPGPVSRVGTSAGASSAAPTQPDDGIADIVVTAQKRPDRVQSLPVAVTALDQSTLASATITNLRDIAARVPSLVVDSVGAGPSAAAISIRGISFEDIEKSFDPAVGVVVDGVFIGTNTGQLLDSFDLERLEVLRGPQGTLFGRNTIAGVINVTRTRPTEEAGARGSFSYANFDTKRGRLVINSGTLGGIVALKAFGFYDDTGGYYHNVIRNRRDGQYETLTGGISALITPTDAIKVLLTYEHERERGETIVSSLSETGKDLICLAPGAPGFAPAAQCNRGGLPDHGLYTTFGEAPTPVRNDTDAITANIDIDLGGGFSLASVTGYRKNKESVRQDFDATSVAFFETQRNQHYEQFSQEIRIVGDLTDWLNVLVGGYYFTSNYQLDQKTDFGAVLGGGAPFLLEQYVDHHTKSYAGFADARIKLSDKLTLGVGARYTNDHKRIFNNYGQIPTLVQLSLPTYTGVECVAVTGLLFPGVPKYGAATNCNGSKGFGKFTWRANADYQFTPSKLVYASYSRGFRSGGFNGRGTTPSSLGPYQPETVDAYEVGLKADWLDRHLRTNIALYHTDYSNKQEEIVQPSAPGAANPQETVVKNAASARINGLEIEVIAQPSRALSFHGSFSYTDAKYKNFFNDVNGDLIPDDVSTLTLRRAPKFQWSAGLDYTRDIGIGRLDFNSTLRFQSKYQTCIAPAQPVVLGAVTNDPRCETDDREDLQAELAYTMPVGPLKDVRFAVFGRNLTNNTGLASTLPVAGLFTFGTAKPPRTYGAEISFKF